MPPKAEASTTASRFGRVKSSLKMGVVGLPNVGKSSLFNLLTAQAVAAENYPFCTIEPNEARCAVPDERFDWLCSLWKSPSLIQAYLHVTDIAGLIKGASEGAGLGNAFLSHIQAVDGIYHVVRVFENDDVVHVDSSVDPVRDLETIQSELCKKDLEILARAVATEELAVKKGGGRYKLSPLFIETTNKLKEMLESNTPVRSGSWTNPEIDLINDKMQLITTKPVIYLVNMSMNDYVRKKNKWLVKVFNWIKEHGGGVMIPFSVDFEVELWNRRDDPEGRAAFLAEKGNPTSALPKIIQTGYHELNLIHFFTAGEKEVRAWTVYKGALAPQAAGVIHSDFERGFIKAEVVAFEDYKALSDGQKGMGAVKAAGKYRIEGRNYVMQDGDIVLFQFNVTTSGKK